MASSSKSSSKAKALKPREFPPIRGPFVDLADLKEYARNYLFYYQAKFLSDSKTAMHTLSFFPDYPYGNMLLLDPFEPFTESLLWYFWCLGVLYFFPLIFPTQILLCFLQRPESRKSLLWTFLEWYQPTEAWWKMLEKEVHNHHGRTISTIFILHRPYVTDFDFNTFVPEPECIVWKSYIQKTSSTMPTAQERKELCRILELNNAVPRLAVRFIRDQAVQTDPPLTGETSASSIPVPSIPTPEIEPVPNEDLLTRYEKEDHMFLH